MERAFGRRFRGVAAEIAIFVGSNRVIVRPRTVSGANGFVVFDRFGAYFGNRVQKRGRLRVGSGFRDAKSAVAVAFDAGAVAGNWEVVALVLASLRPSPVSLWLATLSRKREKGFGVSSTRKLVPRKSISQRGSPKPLSRLRERVASLSETGEGRSEARTTPSQPFQGNCRFNFPPKS